MIKNKNDNQDNIIDKLDTIIDGLSLDSDTTEQKKKQEEDTIFQKYEEINGYCKKITEYKDNLFDIIQLFHEINQKTQNTKVFFYSPITSYVYQLDEATRECFLNNMQSIYNKIIDSNESNDIKRIVSKFLDHSMLAYLQTAEKQVFIKEVKKFKIEKQEISDKLESANKEIKKLQDENSKIQINSVTVLGIFTAIVATFFGFTNFSSSIFSNMVNVETAKLLMLTSLTALCFSLLLKILIKFVCKINKEKFCYWSYVEIILAVVFVFMLFLNFHSDYKEYKSIKEIIKHEVIIKLNKDNYKE